MMKLVSNSLGFGWAGPCRKLKLTSIFWRDRQEKIVIASSSERATHVYRERVSFVVGAEGYWSSPGRDETD